MRILVTGAGGFIGRGLLESLARAGHPGIASGRVFPADLPAGWIAVTRRDVLASPAVERGVDAVVHLEVKQHVQRPTAADLVAFETVNIGGTREWLAWAAASGVRRFVFASSVKAEQASGGVVDETAAPETSDPYGRSKAAAEAAVRDWVDQGDDRAAVTLRFAPVYGPGNAANLASFARQILQGKPCLIGDGNVRKSVLARANAVAAIEHVLVGMRPGYDVFQVSDRDTCTLAELAAMIANAGNAPPPRQVPRFAAAALATLGDVVEAVTGRGFVLDSRRFHALTQESVFPIDKLLRSGFTPVQSTREGVAEMVRWLG